MKQGLIVNVKYLIQNKNIRYNNKSENNIVEKNAFIITIFTNNNIINGLVKNIDNHDMNIYQIGNLVSFKKFARENTLGTISCEMEKNYVSISSNNSLIFNIINIICFMLNSFFIINTSISIVLYNKIILFLDETMILMKYSEINNQRIIIKNYLLIELEILVHTGYINKNKNNEENIRHIIYEKYNIYEAKKILDMLLFYRKIIIDLL